MKGPILCRLSGLVLLAVVLATVTFLSDTSALAQHEGHGASAPAAGVSGLPMQAGLYRVEVSTDPATIPVGKAKLRLKITDALRKA